MKSAVGLHVLRLLLLRLPLLLLLGAIFVSRLCQGFCALLLGDLGLESSSGA